MPIDPILSIASALLILRSTWQLLKQSTGVLMEGVPRISTYEAIGRSLAALPGVSDVHDLHVWNMSPGMALSAHLSIARGDDWPATLAQARRLLARLPHPACHASADVAGEQRDGRPARDSRAHHRPVKRVTTT